MNEVLDLTRLGIPGEYQAVDRHKDRYKQLDSGLYVPQYIQRYPRAFDFFAGCGGFSLGIIQAGFEVVGALEWDCSAAHTYMHNLGSYPIQIHYSSDAEKEKLELHFEKAFKKHLKPGKNIVADVGDLNDTIHVSGSGWRKEELEMGNYYPPVRNFFFGDIRKYSGQQILEKLGMQVGEMDLIVGGPPCQGFSNANNKSPLEKRNDPRNDLVFEYARMLCEIQPKTFVMENVPCILSMYTANGVPVIHQFLRILEDGNFMTYESGLKALDIREKDIKTKLKYVPVTAKMKPAPKKEKKRKVKKTKQLGFKFQRITTETKKIET